MEYSFYGIDNVRCRFVSGGCEVVASGMSHCAFSASLPRNGIHVHDCYEVCIILSGSGYFYQNGQEYRLEEGSVVVGEPYMSHEIAVDAQNQLNLGFFTFYIRGDYEKPGPAASFLEKHETVAYNCYHIVPYFYMLTSYAYSGGTAALPKLTELMVTDIMASLSDSENNAKGGRYSPVKEKLTEYVLNHPHKKILVSDLSRQCGMSERALYYYFEKNLKTTPSEFIGRTRISAACEYLQMGFTVSATASRLGFTDLSAFSRLFKRHKGISPRQYVKNTFYSV